ncbi:Atypical serine/threonine protein kinase BUD32 [Saitozyma sp. JCM 24511]|nr:Atypical serine/threonine protein kinase BUD32 [Saitozyma sp. JCM 24511]
MSLTYVPPSHRLIQQSELIKQGAEARVYLLSEHLPAPEIYWPPSSSSSAPRTTSDSQPIPTSGPPATSHPESSHGSHLHSHSHAHAHAHAHVVGSPHHAHPTGASLPSHTHSHSHTHPAHPARTPTSLILKHRFPKTYRHPHLDLSLTRTRLSFEARALARAQRAGVSVPKVLWVDPAQGLLGLEKVEGWSVREILGGGAEGEVEAHEGEEEGEEEIERGPAEGSLHEEGGLVEDEAESEGMQKLKQLGVTQEHLMKSMGAALASLHLTTIIHGDLTTSNMMVRLTPGSSEPYEVVLIDFGLASTAQYAENYAVDLYVLERAFASTHPASEGLYAGVLEAYSQGLGEKKWKPIEQKLKEVRLRGRKRDMTG